jgi:ACS family glucarate transporter-like MFS transporter
MSEVQHSQRGTLLPIRYVLVFWLFVLSAVAYLDRTNISIAGVQIGIDFHIDKIHLGWVFSAFLVGYACFQIPAGLLARKLGPRRLLGLGVLWWSLFTAITALAPAGIRGALILLVLVRFALGVGEATMYPATSQFVERWFPIAERGKANGLIFGGVGAGAGLTPPLVTAIILHYGWRASFWFSAVVGTVAALVWYLASRDAPEQHPWVSEEEETLIRETRSLPVLAVSETAPSSLTSPGIPWKRIISSNAVLSLTLSYFSFGYVAWIFFAWFYIYMAQVRGLNLKSSALYSMLPFIAMTIGCLGGGVVSDWIASRFSLRLGRCLLPALALATTAVLLVLGSRAHSTAAAGWILACGAGVLYIAQSGFWAAAADVSGEHVGVVSGIMNMGGQIGGACTASLTPLLAAHFGWQTSFFFAAGLSLFGAVLWTTVQPNRTL